MKSFMLLIAAITICIYVQISSSQPAYVEQVSGVTVNLMSVGMSASYPTAVWVCGYNGTVIKTTNEGSNWINVSGNGISNTINLVNIFGMDQNNALVAGYTSAGTFVFKTTNGGLNWSQVFTQTSGYINAVWMKSSLLGFMCGNPVGGRWSLWRTSNGGSNWDSTGMYLQQAGSEIGWNNSLAISGNNRLWFGTNNSRIYFSSNYGSNWQILSTNPEVNSYCINFYWGDSVYGYFGGANVYKTSNSGYNWTSMSCPGSGNFGGFCNGWEGVNGIYPPMVDFAIRNDSSLYGVSNFGSSWTRIYSASSGVYRHIAYAFVGGYPYSWAVRSNGGITRLVIGGGEVKRISSLIPESYKLEQNYPNPFNPTTTIRLSVPLLSQGGVSRSDGVVKLTVYDVLGRAVTVLVNQQLTPGEYETTFDASKIASGIYYYQLEAGAYSQTKKMVVLK